MPSSVYPVYIYQGLRRVWLMPLSCIVLLPLTSYGNDNSQDYASEANTALFLSCATLKTDAARLACYDKVANEGVSTVAQEKQPLDIIKSVEASFKERTPKVILSDEATQKIIEPQIDTANQSNLSISPMLQPTETQVLAQVGVTEAELQRYTPLSLAYDLDKDSEQGTWSARPYHPMYLLPVFATFERNLSPQTPTQDEFKIRNSAYQPVELKAQISLKTKVMQDLFDSNADLWFGYTQQMHWQVYNEDESRPFRATDYMPEFFATLPVTAELPMDGNLRMLGAGAIHHSNGKGDPESRSWNRLYLMGGAEWGKLSVVPRVWTHVKSETSATPSDNPDITDYYGHGDINFLYDLGKGETVSAMGRYNFGKGNGAVEMNYTYPFTNDVHGFLQLFHGYGESIIDYNEKTTSVGVGVTLSDWKGL